mmetsp:Transcript_33137/g.45912  ORF Transcript_33137/g.45912 Transcript_33137/m.45912 type:complete len:87 (+) Transcript_33137:143-403(+)
MPDEESGLVTEDKKAKDFKPLASLIWIPFGILFLALALVGYIFLGMAKAGTCCFTCSSLDDVVKCGTWVVQTPLVIGDLLYACMPC